MTQIISSPPKELLFCVNSSMRIQPLLFFILLLALQSCVSVKEYQKQYLNDPDMELGQRPIESFDTFGETYREGSAGAVSGETGGGCGCY